MEADRHALNFIGDARSLVRLADLEASFADLATAYGYTSATCVMMAEPGKPVQPRVLFA